jgi:hypothetical protein
MPQITLDTHFIKLVRRMRHSQKRYFLYRNSVDLRDAKKLEAECDEWLDKLFAEVQAHNNEAHQAELLPADS